MEAAGKQTLSGEIYAGSYTDGCRPIGVCGVVRSVGQGNCAHVITATERQFRGTAIDLHSDIGARTLVGKEYEAQRAWCESSPIRLSDRLISGGSSDDTLAERRPRKRADQQQLLYHR